MVLLHGLNLDSRNFVGMKELAEHFELFAYNFPEASEHYRGDVDDFASLVDDFVNVMGLDRFTLLGVSLGGMIGLRYAGSYPTKVESLILISTRIPGFTAELRAKSHIMADMIAKLEDHKLRWILERLESRHFRSLSPEQRALTASVLQPKQIAFYRQVAASMRDYDGTGDAESLRCPTLLILGTADVLIPLESHNDFKETVDGITIELLDGAQHDVSLLQPELVCRHIHSFIEPIIPFN
jgi:pimeloyl-ACP methyl ester carboxylesterase